MSRVATVCPLVVISPVPWFPFQGLIRFWKPNYRPQPEAFEQQDAIAVYFPRFLSIPGLFRSWDGCFMALCCIPLLHRLNRKFGFDLIDAHFAYPDGYAATLLGRWFHAPVTITLRGTEVPLSKIPERKRLLLNALERAAKIFSVSDSLKQHVVALGAKADKIEVVGNGVDTDKFHAIDKIDARRRLNISEKAQVLISVGGLVERKGFHRILQILPDLIERYPNLIYLIVGGECPEGNIRARLEQQVVSLGLSPHVRFLGAMSSTDLNVPLSAADIFVLATSNEGWANVFLEAMACGLPVVTTDVGGNREVVANSRLGYIVPFGDSVALTEAIESALSSHWDRNTIVAYAYENAWDNRIAVLVDEFRKLMLNKAE